MSLVSVRDCTSAADVIANARAVYARRMAIRPPKLEIVQAEPVEEIQEIEAVGDFPRHAEQHNSHVLVWLKHFYEKLPGLMRNMQAVQTHMMASASGENTYRPPVRDFVKMHAARYEIDMRDLMGVSRRKVHVFPRQKIMWLVHRHYRDRMSYPMIGRMFGDRDHTTVLHAVRKIETLMQRGDPSVADLCHFMGAEMVSIQCVENSATV